MSKVRNGSGKNTIRIIERNGNKLLIRLTGGIVDPDFHDGSKPRSQLLVDTWFTQKENGKRSM